MKKDELIKVRYIPGEQLGYLNRVAKRNGKDYIAEECPLLKQRFGLPVVLSIPVESGWIRCQVPVVADCSSHACLDILSESFHSLPYLERTVEWFMEDVAEEVTQ